VAEFTYLPANRRPEIKLNSPAGDEIWSGAQTVRWAGRDPDRDKLTYETYWSADRGTTWTLIESTPKMEKEPEEDLAETEQTEAEGAEAEDKEPSPALPKAATETPAGKESQPQSSVEQPPGASSMAEGDLEGEDFEVAPEDMLEDEGLLEEMEELEAAGEGEEPPAKVGPPSRATSLTWKTTDVPDGIYWLKIVASDEQANPADPLTADVVSRSFVVDNTPPDVIIDLRREDDSPSPASVTVFDRTTYSTSAEFKVDDGEWLAAIPEDGIFDSQYEAIVLDEARLPEGSHEVTLRARDAAGNVTSKTLRYLR